MYKAGVLLITSCFPYFTGAMCNNSDNYTINKQSTKRQLCTSCFPYFTGAMCNNSDNYTINKQSTKRQLCTSCEGKHDVQSWRFVDCLLIV
jgi:ribosomal protein S26